MTIAEVAVPPVAIETLAGLAAQVAGKAGVPEFGVMMQVTAIVPAKPPTEVNVMVSVLPVVAPEVKLRVAAPALAVEPATMRLVAAEEEAT
jgi:hypothetical protein